MLLKGNFVIANDRQAMHTRACGTALNVKEKGRSNRPSCSSKGGYAFSITFDTAHDFVLESGRQALISTRRPFSRCCFRRAWYFCDLVTTLP